MNKYLVSFGDSDKYAVEFPGTLSQFESSDVLKGLKEKVASFLKDKFPMGAFADVIPVHVEEADGKTDYPQLDMSKIGELLKNVATQIGVEKFTDKLNLNAPFDKL